MKRKHPELTEVEILERIKLGTLILDFDNLQVLTTLIAGGRGSTIPRPLTIRECGKTTKYPYVRIKHNCKRRNISCHRLAWMAHTLEPIPAGCEIHHGEEGPLIWHPRNLFCLTIEEHAALHGKTYEPEFT